ncbi:potassium channel, subfamily K, member 16-like [Amphiura filiformis]|uniref:potassium channel, subfamily K, member 16-like n=1 Tax=Amphiura filiformis TaxID=82378 RepID=UPI003B21EF6F
MSTALGVNDGDPDEEMEMVTEGENGVQVIRVDVPGNSKLSKMKWKKLIILSVVFHVYLILGAGIFHYLESGQEDETRNNVRQLKEGILANYTCLDSDTLEMIIDVVVKAAGNGISPAGNVTSPSNWDFGSAFFFSGITVTTIGYGHIAPTTPAGQTFCIVFALIGIPACGIMLTAIGEKLSNLTEMAERPFRTRLKQKWQRVLFHLCIIGGSMFVFFVTIPAIIFTKIEDWDFQIAWYYCFITVSTIGFGDYVVEQNRDIDYPDVYVVMVYFWIIFGLSYLALIIQQIGKILTSTGKVVQERVSTTVTTVATASMATGRVVHDRVAKQFSHIKGSDANIRYSSSDDEGDPDHKRKRRPSKRLHYRGSKRGSYHGQDTPEIIISPSDDKMHGILTDYDEKPVVAPSNGTIDDGNSKNGNFTVVDPDDKLETETVTSELSVANDNEVELKEVTT